MDKLATVFEAAKHMKVCPDFIYKKLKEGSLPHFKVGSDYRVSLDEVAKHFRVEKRQVSK